jgi:aspartokinase-like uncharacterized kinase
MWVVKLGGSLFTSKHLQRWLFHLSQAESVLIVPGGGPFANRVREAQRQFNFDDSTAHVMALLAMEQYGWMLCGLQQGLRAVATSTQIQEVFDRGQTPVWMPTTMTMADPDISHSWDVTSDSLAAWLCGQLSADHLLLVKSLALNSSTSSPDELAKQGVVDSRFGHYLSRCHTQAMVMADHNSAFFDDVHRGSVAQTTRILSGSDD